MIRKEIVFLSNYTMIKNTTPNDQSYLKVRICSIYTVLVLHVLSYPLLLMLLYYPLYLPNLQLDKSKFSTFPQIKIQPLDIKPYTITYLLLVYIRATCKHIYMCNNIFNDRYALLCS